MIDTTKLRELAQKATPGPWISSNSPGTSKSDVWIPSGEICISYCASKSLALSGNRANSNYIAAANPASVLALLDEIDRLRTIESAHGIRSDDAA